MLVLAAGAHSYGLGSVRRVSNYCGNNSIGSQIDVRREQTTTLSMGQGWHRTKMASGAVDTLRRLFGTGLNPALAG
jgi:hypothetical protein